MEYFKNMDLFKTEFNNLGLDMLEGFLTENKEMLNETFKTMKVLRRFLVDTIEYQTLFHNKVGINLYLENNKKEKKFTVLAKNKERLIPVTFIFPNKKIEDIEDVAITAVAIYESILDNVTIKEVSKTSLELEDIDFLNVNFKSKFLNNNIKEIVSEKKPYKLELDHIEIQFID